MQDLTNAPALTSPRHPYVRSAFRARQRDRHTPRAKNSWKEMGGPHGRRRGCRARLPAVPAGVGARTVTYGMYSCTCIPILIQLWALCSAYGRCVVRLWATYVLSVHFSATGQNAAPTYIHYGIEGTPIVSNMRLSRGVLDSRGVARPTGWRSASRTTSRDGAGPRQRARGP